MCFIFFSFSFLFHWWDFSFCLLRGFLNMCFFLFFFLLRGFLNMFFVWFVFCFIEGDLSFLLFVEEISNMCFMFVWIICWGGSSIYCFSCFCWLFLVCLSYRGDWSFFVCWGDCSICVLCCFYYFCFLLGFLNMCFSLLCSYLFYLEDLSFFACWGDCSICVSCFLN